MSIRTKNIIFWKLSFNFAKIARNVWKLHKKSRKFFQNSKNNNFFRKIYKKMRKENWRNDITSFRETVDRFRKMLDFTEKFVFALKIWKKGHFVKTKCRTVQAYSLPERRWNCLADLELFSTLKGTPPSPGPFLFV